MKPKQGQSTIDTSDSFLRPIIHARVLRSVLDVLGIRAAQRTSLLDRESLSASDLVGPDAVVPLIGYMRIFDRLAEDMKNATLGLDLSEQMGPELVGAIGHIFLLSPSLDDAIAAFSEAVFSIQGVTSLRYHRQPKPSVSYTISDDRLQPRRHDVEFSLGYVHQLIKRYLGDTYAPQEVYFEHPCPNSRARYERVFGCPVYFEQTTNAIVLREEDLHRRGLNHDPHLISILQHYMQLARGRLPNSGGIAEEVQQVLSGLVESRNASCRLVAARLGLKEEALRRRLKQENTCFRDILSRKRCDIAARYLRETRLSILQIAQRVGYAETASFSRAFALQTGMTPSQFRKQ